MKKLKAFFKKWIKRILNKKPKPIYLDEYTKYKNATLTLQRSKKKVKLRKYISELAYKLNEFNEIGYKENRDWLILAFNKGNLEGVGKHYQKQIEAYIKSKQRKLSVA